MKNNKMLMLAIFTLTLGVVMLLGSSYSLINSVVSKESYSFDVANFDVQFDDNTKISINGIPTSDEDGINKSKEYIFTINNNSNHDVNYRLDIIENSVKSMGEVVKYAYSLNDGKYSDIYLLKDNYTINQNKVLVSKGVDTYKLRIWLSIDADEIYMNQTFSASINLQATSNDFKYASSVLEYLANKKMDGVEKVNDDYRYKGSDSLNYVWFNCKNNYTKGDEVCERWRIIGSFNNSWEKSIKDYPSLKIIKPEEEELISYDNENVSKNYEDSYINKYANGAYYDLLNNDTKKYILDARWYIGNSSKDNFDNAIVEEKKAITYANVGMINASDYLFLEDDSWLKLDKDIMTINKHNDDIYAVIDGEITAIASDKILSFMPVIYLKPDVSIISGIGSYDNPYEISIIYPLSYGVKR